MNLGGAWGLWSGLAGGLGLFLLGMTMMTDGLRLAAGPALERILGWATRTRWQALGSGVLVTALVQSSSAVTVAAIGFVNAGLLGLSPALWVLFGANVGTTMTGWIVAMLGLKFKIDALALPLIGVGVLLRLTGVGQRRGALGSALAGFGLLFLGIALLQQAFGGLADTVSLPQGEGLLAVLAQLGVGVLMTVLMQSSSASMVIALTAAQGGLLSAQGAAAVVIGANVGTTVTALLAAVAATPNARRAASAHVIFNAVTAAVALALLPWLVDTLDLLAQALEVQTDPATRLALFHTAFNVLGVALMWPVADRLTRWLQARFRAREDDEAQPRHLDDTVLPVPQLAVEALAREVDRMGHVAIRLVTAAAHGALPAALAHDHAVVQQLDAAAQAFVVRLNRAAMTLRTSAGLAQVLRVQRYHASAAALGLSAAPVVVPPVLSALPGPQDAALADLQAGFLQSTTALLVACDPLAAPPAAPVSADRVEQAMATMERTYEDFKRALLAAGARGELRLADMEDTHRRCGALRHAAQQAAKAVRHRSAEWEGADAHLATPGQGS